MLPSSTSNSDASALDGPDRTRAGLAALAVLAGLALAGRIPLEPLTANLAGERVAYRVEVHQLDPRWVADAGPRSRHAANGQGLRGDVIVGRDRELLLLGGSTVECSLLDERQALTGALAQALRDAEGPPRVAALAQAGLPLAELLPELDAFTADERRPTIWVGMFGANETQAMFNHAPWASSGPGQPWAVWLDPASPFGVHGREQLYRGWYQPGNGGRFLAAPRAAYADPSLWQAELHPAHYEFMRQSLRGYVDSLRELQRLARDRGASLILVTQPLAPWAPPAEGRGWAPFVHAAEGQGFLPSPQLTATLLDAFNAQTRGFAGEHGLPLVDLAAELDGCAACFYDQWHFTNTGATRAAERIAELARPSESDG